MIPPVRLRRSRRAGFRLQAASLAINGLPAIFVGRPTVWGNPFRIGANLSHLRADAGAATAEQCVELHRGFVDAKLAADPALAGRIRKALGGKNLACWCALDPPCHADTLLELANG